MRLALLMLYPKLPAETIGPWVGNAVRLAAQAHADFVLQRFDVLVMHPGKTSSKAETVRGIGVAGMTVGAERLMAKGCAVPLWPREVEDGETGVVTVMEEMSRLELPIEVPVRAGNDVVIELERWAPGARSLVVSVTAWGLAP